MDTYHRIAARQGPAPLALVAEIIGADPTVIEREFSHHADFHWGSLGEWVSALIHGRQKAAGLGVARLRRLQAALTLADWLAYEELSARPTLNSPMDCEHYLRCHLVGRERELFCALYLNGRHRLLGCDDIFEGTVDCAAVYPRDVVLKALQWGASSLIIAHNHPSGSLHPSAADRQITRRLREALGLVDIQLLDHLIVARGGIYSMASHGEAGF